MIECIAVILQLPNWLYCVLFDQIMGLYERICSKMDENTTTAAQGFHFQNSVLLTLTLVFYENNLWHFYHEYIHELHQLMIFPS